MLSDLRYAFRTLLNNPGFTIVAVVTLALGIGATTAIFSVFDAVVLKSLPVRNPDELYLAGVGHYRAYQAFRQETDLFSEVLARPRPAEQPWHILAPHHRQAAARHDDCSGGSQTDDHVSSRTRD